MAVPIPSLTNQSSSSASGKSGDITGSGATFSFGAPSIGTSTTTLLIAGVAVLAFVYFIKKGRK